MPTSARKYRAYGSLLTTVTSLDGEGAKKKYKSGHLGEWSDVAVLICELPTRHSANHVEKDVRFEASDDDGVTWIPCDDPRHATVAV